MGGGRRENWSGASTILLCPSKAVQFASASVPSVLVVLVAGGAEAGAKDSPPRLPPSPSTPPGSDFPLLSSSSLLLLIPKKVSSLSHHVFHRFLRYRVRQARCL